MSIMELLTNGSLIKQAEQLASDLPLKIAELESRLLRMEQAIEQSNVMISQVWHRIVPSQSIQSPIVIDAGASVPPTVQNVMVDRNQIHPSGR